MRNLIIAKRTYYSYGVNNAAEHPASGAETLAFDFEDATAAMAFKAALYLESKTGNPNYVWSDIETLDTTSVSGEQAWKKLSVARGEQVEHLKNETTEALQEATINLAKATNKIAA